MFRINHAELLISIDGDRAAISGPLSTLRLVVAG